MAEKASEAKWGKQVMALGFCMVPSLLLRAQQRMGLNPTQLALLMHLADYWWDVQRKRSSITELSLHGINTSRQSGKVLPMCPVKDVTYVSGRSEIYYRRIKPHCSSPPSVYL